MTIISGLPDDTVQACRDRSVTDYRGRGEVRAYIDAAYYVNGHGAPHYQLPVIPRRVVWRPRGMYPLMGKHRAYFAISTKRLLWTFWQGLGLFEETAD